MPTVTKASNAHTIVTTGWTNPSNAFATTGDNTYATGTPGKNSTVSGDFGFADFTTGDIPDGSTINSVTVTVEWGMTAAVTGGTLGIQLRNNGVNQGTETTKTTTTEAQSTQQVISGISLSDLRSASTLIKARTRVSQGNTSSAMTGNVDFITLTVDYTPPIILPKTITQAVDAERRRKKFPGAYQISGNTTIGPIGGTSAITLPMLTWSSSGSATSDLPAASGQFIKMLAKNRRQGAAQISGVIFISTEDQSQVNINLPMLTWSMVAGAPQAPTKVITVARPRVRLLTGAVTQLAQLQEVKVQTATLSFNLPLLTWSMAGILPGNDLNMTLPMLTWQSSGVISEDQAFFWMNIWKKQRERNKGKTTFVVPTKQLATGNLGQLIVNLPMLTWTSQAIGSNTGQLLITLPKLTWSSQATLPIDGQIALTLPMLTWNMADANATQGTINLQLPMMTLKMIGQLQEQDGSIVGPGLAEGQLFPR